VTEDGAQYLGHTMIDWAGKAAWDPVSRRAMWAATGAGNNFAGGHRFNTHSTYDELTDTWSVRRAFESPNESNSNAIVHMYDSNCVDVAGRRFYKKKFATPEIMAFDLASNRWLPTIASPANEASYARDGAMEVVPSRGSAGALWVTSLRSGTDRPTLWELELPGSTWRELINDGGIGPNGSSNSPVLSFNPRALGGDGGVLLGNGAGAWVIAPQTLARTQLAPPPRPLRHAHDRHLCRDPAGDGWLLAASDGFLYWTNGGPWVRRAALPGPLATPNHGLPVVCIPIDTYGVAWFITSASSGDRAWLYRP
jgi:hypothetical protein